MKCPKCGEDISRSPKRTTIIPRNQVSSVCSGIMKNIACYCNTAEYLMQDSEQCFHRMPYVFILIALDEAGKAINLIKKTAEAETANADTVVDENWYYHTEKGPEAGELGLITIDWFLEVLHNQSVMKQDIKKIKNGGILEGYRTHLIHLKSHFSEERCSIMYADFDNKTNELKKISLPDISYIVFDMFLLRIFIDIVEKSISTEKSFNELINDMQSIRKSFPIN